jgi:hypothetical protein
MRSTREQLVHEITGLERVVAFSCKGQFGAARIWSHLHLWIGLPTAALAAISGGTALANHRTLAAGLALAVSVSTAIVAFLNPAERHKVHHAAGNEYSKLARDLRLWRQFEQPELSDEVVLAKIREFQSERDRLNEQSPQVGRITFLWAKRRVDRQESIRRERAEARRSVARTQ